MKDNKHKPASKQPNKALFTIRIGSEVLQAAKRVAYWTPGLTLGALVEESLRREIARLEKSNGEPFPPAGKLRSGRPLKT